MDAGLAEVVRVARHRIVLLTIDTDALRDLWITRDYFPASLDVDRARMPAITRLRDALPATTLASVPVPRACQDGFGIGLWDRPEAILDPEVRRASSIWHEMPAEAMKLGLRRLHEDLESGRWDERYGHLRTAPELDVGLRLVVSQLD